MESNEKQSQRNEKQRQVKKIKCKAMKSNENAMKCIYKKYFKTMTSNDTTMTSHESHS